MCVLKKAHIAPKKIEQNEGKKHNRQQRTETKTRNATIRAQKTETTPEMVLLERRLCFSFRESELEREFVRKKK